jgi:hypothetical protein
MKIKIIKGGRQQKTEEKFLTTEENIPSRKDTQRAITLTIKSWIEDLREKRSGDRLLVKRIFGVGNCG